MNEFGPWDQFVAFVNRAGWAWKNLLGQDKVDEWTPTLNFDGVSTGITYSAQSGYAVKLGLLVFVMFRITLTSKGSATGNAYLGGLPFPARANTNFAQGTGPVLWSNMTSSLTTCFILQNTASGPEFHGTTAAATTSGQLDDADFADNTSLIGSFSYIASK